MAIKDKNTVTVAYFSFLVFVEWCVNGHRLVGQVVRRPPRERKIRGSSPACAGIFPGSSHTSDLKICHSSGYPARRLAL